MPAASTSDSDAIDLFVSYAGPDRPWAEWAAWQLKEAGYSVELDVWDWSAGDNAVLRMNDALARAGRLLALCSPDYFDRPRFTTDEWTAVLAERPDEQGSHRLVPVRVTEVQPPPILRSAVYVDLFGLAEPAAREALLRAVGGPARPSTAPRFPGGRALAGVVGAGPRVPGSLPPVWNVRPRNPAFTGREAQLAALRQRLCAGDRTLVQALHGMGGVGKTQLAVEYAYLFGNEYDLVWWLDAEQPDLLGEQLAELAAAAEWTPEGTPNADAKQAVMRRLREDARWLLIFDNAETVDHVREWIPTGGGHLIITSRSGRTGGIAVPVEVDVFHRDESVALLQTNLPTMTVADADRLAATVGDLPLALAQAAGLLAETGMTINEYLTELREHATELLSDQPPGDYPQPLAAVITTSVRRLDQVDPAAVQLLHLCAMLAPEPIPLRWFTQPPPDVLGGPLAAATASRVAFRRSLGRLAAFGLARVDSDSIQLHRLTQAVLRDTAGESAASDREAVQRLISAATPGSGNDVATWPAWAELLPHLLVLNPATTPALASATHRALNYLLARGEPKSALTLATEWHDHWSSTVDPDDQRVTVAQEFVANSLQYLGRYNEARLIQEKTLDRHRRLRGDDHPDALRSAHNLALILHELGKHERARQLNEETLTQLRRVHGDDHPDTLHAANDLADMLRAVGDIERARQLDEDTLTRRRRLLGDDHPDTLFSARGLAIDLRELGEHERARQLDEDTLTRRRRVLGDDHPDTLRSANSLAIDLRRLGEYEQARQLEEDSLRRRRRVLGDDHPDTLRSANNVAVDLRRLGEYEQARQLDEDTLTRRRRMLGDDHPNTLRSANNLAIDLRQLGEYERAERLDNGDLDG